MPYEVQTYMICQGWINCWIVEENGVSKSQIFETQEEAQAALDEFMADIHTEIENGEREAEDGYDLEDYRIVKISDKPPTLG